MFEQVLKQNGSLIKELSLEQSEEIIGGGAIATGILIGLMLLKSLKAY